MEQQTTNMVDVTYAVGSAAIVCTVASNFAGLPTCLNVVRKKSTEGVASLPFFSAAINSSLWLLYGYLIGDGAVMAVNVVAFFLQCFYIGCFFYATEQKAVFAKRLIGLTLIILSFSYHAFGREDKQDAVQIVGLFSCAGSIATCASPLAGLKDVLRDRSTRHLPFLIIVTAFATTSLWFIYGCLIGDTFILVPNLIAALLSGFQLSLFAIFDSKPKEE